MPCPRPLVLPVLRSGRKRWPACSVCRAFVNDRLQEHYLRTTEAIYVVENRSGQARAVYLGLPVVDNAKVTGADALDYDTATSRPIAIFRMEARQKLERAVKLEEGLTRPLAVADLTSERLKKLAAGARLPEAERKAAAGAVEAQARVEETAAALAKVQAEIGKVEKDLNRLERHLQALGEKGAASASPFVQRILAAEDRLETLRKRSDELTAAALAQREAVREALKALGG